MKNKYRFLKYILTVSLAISLTACNDFLEVNVSPDLTLSNPPNLILPSAQANLGLSLANDMTFYTLFFAQQIAAQNGRQTENYDTYVLTPTDVNTIWRTNLYGGPLADTEEILKKDVTAVHPHYFGISKLLKAFTFSIITDVWGDVPYSEALKGTDNKQPKLDKSQDIYPSLIQLIDSGIADLKKASPLVAPGVDDVIYKGNAARWIRMANTLKLRLYLHMANVTGFDLTSLKTFVTNTPATEFMTAIADDFLVPFQATNNRQNPRHQFVISRTDDICTSSTIINMMNDKLDPRRPFYFTPSPFSPALMASPPTGKTGYVGLRNGTSNGGLNNNLSRLHTFMRGAVTTAALPAGPALGVMGLAYDGNTPVRLLTFAEYNFIRAEMALRYGTAGDAEKFYQDGISASMAAVGVASKASTDYLASSIGKLDGATTNDKLQKLIEEKYVANFLIPVEPWNDWRRTGFPLLQLLPAAVNPGNGGKVPRTLPYPQQEVDANPNMQARQNLSDKPVYWDVRTTGQQ